MALSSFLVGAVQMTSGGDRARNLETALRLVGRGGRSGAKLIGLPENFSFMGRDEDASAGRRRIEGPTIEALRGVARQRGVHVLAGSFPERVAEAGKTANTSVLIGDHGGSSRSTARSTSSTSPSRTARATRNRRRWRRGETRWWRTTALGRIGLSVCYDLRFPELYRKLSEARRRIHHRPGRLHALHRQGSLGRLLRARAIENQAYVLAPAQCGRHSANRVTFGNTMIVRSRGGGAGALPGGGRGPLRGRGLARAPRAGAARGAGAEAPADVLR